MIVQKEMVMQQNSQKGTRVRTDNGGVSASRGGGPENGKIRGLSSAEGNGFQRETGEVRMPGDDSSSLATPRRPATLRVDHMPKPLLVLPMDCWANGHSKAKGPAGINVSPQVLPSFKSYSHVELVIPHWI